MWVGKFKIRHDDWILPKTLKYCVSATGIPLNAFSEGGKKYHTGMIFLKGEEENKKRFIASLRKDDCIKHFDVKGNQVFVLIEGEDMIAHAFDASLYFVKPVLLKEGYEYWELGSWKRSTLTEFYKKAALIAEVEILKLQRKLPSVFVQHDVPKMTRKQREAIEFAQEMGYYAYPRKISVEELAAAKGVPRTTFQEHLRKAESKVMGVLLGDFGE